MVDVDADREAVISGLDVDIAVERVAVVSGLNVYDVVGGGVVVSGVDVDVGDVVDGAVVSVFISAFFSSNVELHSSSPGLSSFTMRAYSLHHPRRHTGTVDASGPQSYLSS